METVVLGLGLAGFVVALVVLGWREGTRLSVNPLGYRARSSKPKEDRLLAALRSAAGGHGARVEPYSRGALVGLHPGDAFTVAELRAATSYRDPEGRLRAGIELGQDGRDVLLALAADGAVEDRCSAQAIGALASAARNAIAEIQSRLTGSPGELSLAQGEAGHLSLADDTGGRVSLPGADPCGTDKGGSR